MKKISNYQIIGANFLASKRHALLADDMGVGKTAQAILASDLIDAKSILVICPAVARVNWKREFAEWSVFSPSFTVCETLKDPISKHSIVSYDYATENVKDLIKEEWDLVISDESHFVKEPEARRTQAVYGVNGIIRKTKYFWALSGTPAPNNASELWPMLFTYGITTLKYEDFISRYCRSKATYYGGSRRLQVTGTLKARIPEIKEMLSQIMLRRMKEDVLTELPPITFDQVSVEGTPLVNVIEEDLLRIKAEQKLIEDQISIGLTIDQILEKLGNSVSTLRRYVGLQKVEAVSEIIANELECGLYDKIGIFAIHTEVIEQLRQKLIKYNPVVITGKTRNKQTAVDSFQMDPNCQVFLGNIKAAGVAITLTAAHQAFFVEQSWVPGENDQASDRFHRRGALLPVYVRCASLANSFDEKVTASLVRKANELNEIFSSNSATATHHIGA